MLVGRWADFCWVAGDASTCPTRNCAECPVVTVVVRMLHAAHTHQASAALVQLCRQAVPRALSTALAYYDLQCTTYIVTRSQVPCLLSDAQVLGCGCPALAASRPLACRSVYSAHLVSGCCCQFPSGTSLLPCARHSRWHLM